MLSRRCFLGSTIAAGLTGAAYLHAYEPEWLDFQVKLLTTTRHELSGLRIAHVSDFHLSHPVPLSLIEKAADMTAQAAPDLICITGDFVTHKLSQEAEYARVLAKFAAAAPTYACFGNHDGGAWARTAGGYKSVAPVAALLTASGIQPLRNELQVQAVRGAQLQIIGLGDYWAGECQPERVFPVAAKDMFTVLLSHNPDSKEELSSFAWDLMLSGHTHGGQVVVPFLNYAPIVPVRDRSFISGLREWQSRHIHISRGVGNIHGIRFNCRPEVSVIELVAA